MILSAEIAGRRYSWDAARPIELSLPLHLHPEQGGRQPRSFGAPPATATTYTVGSFVADTRLGGSCNVETLALTPHCNGTHTECIGHVVDERVFVPHLLREAFFPATLLSVAPHLAPHPTESSTPAPQPGDALLTAEALSAARAATIASDGFTQALILRTLPNHPDKATRDYTGGLAPYFTAEAMQLIVSWGVQHLVVDLPSVDRLDDGGHLATHRVFWGLPPAGRLLAQARRPLGTISELAFVPDHVPDGPAILQLQLPPLLTDAVPSRLFLYDVHPA